MDKKQSQFTEISELTSSKYVPVFGSSSNEKISKENLFSQIREEAGAFIYPTIELLQAASLVADPDWPVYVRVEETEYRLYKITSLAAGENDISLTNGTTATFQEEYSEIGFVVGPDVSVDGAIAVFSGTTGTELENGPVPSTIGEELLTISDFDNTGYFRVNADNTVTIRSVADHKTDLSINNVNNTSDADKPISDAAQTAFDAIDTALTFKAPLSSPGFTGNPTAPTPSANDNDTSIATSAFVRRDAVTRADTFAGLASITASVGNIIETAGHTLPGVDSAKFIAKSGNVTTIQNQKIDSATADVYWDKFADNKLSEVIRDIISATSPAFNIGGLVNRCMLKKLRTDYLEFAIYTPMTTDGKYWARWLFTNRFNLSVTGSAGAGGAIPRMIMCTLAAIFPQDEIAKVAENKPTGTTATAATVTKLNTDGVEVGTWTSPTTFGGVSNINYSTTIGDTKTWTVTGAERYTMESVFLSNGGIANVKVYTDAGLTTEIPEGNYLTPSNRLVHFSGGSNNLQHIPLCYGLTSGSTYYIRTTVDATNPGSGRVYQGRIFGYDDIEYDDIVVLDGKGIHGVVDDASLASQTNSRSYNPGTRAIYKCENCTMIDWRYVETTSGSIVTFLVYDSTGTPISTYVNPYIDTYAPGSTAKKVTVARNLPLGDYYLHVTNGKTRNASNVVTPGYRYYDFGVVTYDETTAGTIEEDDFNDFDVPNIITDPNNDSGNGTDYLLIGTGNLELAISARKTTDDVGDEEFLGGIHGFETTPTPVFRGDGDVVDFAGGAQFDTWFAGEFTVELDTTLRFPVDGTDFCDVEYLYGLSQSGYSVATTKTTQLDSYIHNEYSIMLNVPNTDMSQSGKPTQGLLTGGGFEKVGADINYIINDYDNSSTLIQPYQRGVAFVNNEYFAMCAYVVEPTRPVEMTVYPYSQGNFRCLVQDRTDRTIKFYTKAFDGDATNGVLVPSGTSWGEVKTYRPGAANIKNLLGFGV